ncbi:MAG: hypothetical protein OEL82_04420 [Nitrosopumilus sp.]|nr:hypothetical protein [Nitrosopumilus sp.]
MKKIIFYNLSVMLFLVAFFAIYDNDLVYGQTSSENYTIKGHDTVYSQYIPLYGTFSVQMEYAIPVKIYNPESIRAGNSFDVLIMANKPGNLVTTFLQDKNILGKFEDKLKIGEEKIIEIPESLVGQVFAMPHILIQPAIKGPATITPEHALFDSETIKQFQVFVDEDIEISDSLKIELNFMIKMKNGGNLNLAIAKLPLGEHTSDIQAKPITKQIHLKKIILTNLHLQVKQGDIPEHIKVKTLLTNDLQVPIAMLMHSVEIYIDGVPQTKVVPNEWSDNIFVGAGIHNFQARFSETRDSNNIAIEYTSADSAIKTITVISNNTSAATKIQCGSEMMIKDGQCIQKEEEKPTSFGGGGCLIATATYGTELDPQIQFLREIRDNTVMSTASGTAFMTEFNQIYYSFSPVIADMERENFILKEAIKIALSPMLVTLHLMEYAEEGSEFDVLIFGASTILTNLGIYLFAPLAAIYQLKKLVNR